MDWFLYDRKLRHERVKDKGTYLLKYRKIPVIIPRFILIQKPIFGGFIFGKGCNSRGL